MVQLFAMVAKGDSEDHSPECGIVAVWLLLLFEVQPKAPRFYPMCVSPLPRHLQQVIGIENIAIWSVGFRFVSTVSECFHSMNIAWFGDHWESR